MALPTQTPPGDKDEQPKRSLPTTDSLLDYFKTHSRETISYALLVIGIILLFFEALYGGVLVGIVAGIYFGDEVVNYIKQWNVAGPRGQHQDLARHIIALGVALAFFIAAPAIFLGAAISIGIKQLFLGQGNIK